MSEKQKSKYCQIVIRISQEEFDIIQGIREKTSLSYREIVGYSSKPCDCCKGLDVVAYNSQDKNVKIKRGLLFHSLLHKYGHYTKTKK
jgi:hypothetical protein